MKRWVVPGQVALAGLLLWLVGREVAGRWSEFQTARVDLSLRPGWILASAALTLLTFGTLIQSWRLVLAGWQQRLSGRDLAETWFVANLGRYVPGKVWSVAGMIVLASRKGVEAWAASAAAVVVQALGLVTAILVAVATLPRVATGFRMLLVGAGAAAVVTLFASDGAVRWAAARVPRVAPLRPLGITSLIGAAVVSILGWAGYGAALWALARGLGQPDALPIELAIGGFALAYTAGLLALFAPGGIVVREGVLVALLSPGIGAPAAVALSLASRLLLTAMELVAAIPFVWTWSRSAPRAAG